MSRMAVQQIMEGLPVLPKGIYPDDLAIQLQMPADKRSGFRHSTGEWNFLYRYEGRQYRLPENLAIALMNNTTREM